MTQEYICPKCGSWWINKIEHLNTPQVLYQCSDCKISTDNKQYFVKMELAKFDNGIRTQ